MEEHRPPHKERHKSNRSGWLRAAVLGVNDGTVSTASLMLGVSAASAAKSTVLTAGIAGLVAGAMSMAIGEYVSVSSQKDSQQADIDIEKRSIARNPKEELAELAWIYEQRGLDAKLAKQVAQALHNNDAVSAHARDELGIDQDALANPIQAALASAISFSIGAIVPIIAAVFSDKSAAPWSVVITSLILLAISGALGASIGGGRRMRATIRVFVGGGLAMAVTALIGRIVGTRL